MLRGIQASVQVGAIMGLLEDILLMGANLGFVVYLILGVIIASALVGWWYIKIRPYPISVDLWTHYNNAIVKSKQGTKAGIITLDNKKYFKLQHDTRVLLPASVFADVAYGETLSLFQISPGKYLPMPVNIEKETIDGIETIQPKHSALLDEQAYAYSFADSVKYNQERFKFTSLLMEYMPIITVVLLAIMLLVISFVVGGYAVKSAEEFHKASDAYHAAAIENRKSSEYLYAIALNRSIINLPTNAPPA